MTRIINTTLPLASRREVTRITGQQSVLLHRACRSELRPLPGSVVDLVRLDYRHRRAGGRTIAEARAAALCYLDGYADGWNERMLRWQDRMIDEAHGAAV